VILAIVVALLVIAVAWLALRHTSSSAQDSRVGAITQRLTALEQTLANLRQAASQQALQTSRSVAANSAAIKKLAAAPGSNVLPVRCAAEIQEEIDDIRGYIAYGSGISRRVTPDCKVYLRPRYGG
jgi:hypothetical protein